MRITDGPYVAIIWCEQMPRSAKPWKCQIQDTRRPEGGGGRVRQFFESHDKAQLLREAQESLTWEVAGRPGVVSV